MVCLRFKRGTAGWKVQAIPLSYGGPISFEMFQWKIKFDSSIVMQSWRLFFFEIDHWIKTGRETCNIQSECFISGKSSLFIPSTLGVDIIIKF